MLEIPTENFLVCDLNQPWQIDKQFDLVVCLEVADRLHPEYAKTFVNSLVKLVTVILFSAAIPFKGGTNHLN
ncbi:MAG: hypothetical protein MUE44_21205 [Oscillatoriaceae cyanobacterium Prado104]|jgi:2-polyprenyl-3-methyl-5-hydroxy-6-metoxy-1,4-benzoquinol methylase|nr:hypothetical protein [Oscillatoriaceae cyanobacterium Prado104]